MYWQRQLEEKAFVAGGRTYAAPAQRVEDLLKDRRSSRGGRGDSSYGCGVVWRDFKDVLPPFVIDTLKLSIAEMDNKLHGFNFPDAVMTGVETRSSSPVRMMRDDNPAKSADRPVSCGEGAGYAGGIIFGCRRRHQGCVERFARTERTIKNRLFQQSESES